MIDHLARTGHAATRMVALAGGYLLLGFALMVGVEVICRKFLGFSLQGVDEMGGYVLAITTAFALSYALLRGAHTRMDLVLTRLPAQAQAVLNTLAAAATTAFAVFMAWRALATLLESIAYQSRASTPLQTPLWLPQSIWLAGLVTFALVSAGLTTAACIHLLRGDIRRVNAFAGTKTESAAVNNDEEKNS